MEIPDTKNSIISATPSPILRKLSDIGIQTERSVALHLIHENTFDSNLVPDISEVD